MISEFGDEMFWGSFPFIMFLIVGLIGMRADEIVEFLESLFKNISNTRTKRKREKRLHKENMLKYKISLKKLELIEKGQDVSSI